MPNGKQRPNLASHQRLRVGLDARWYNDSGVGNYTVELARAMAQQDSSVELVIYEDPRNPLPINGTARVRKTPVSAPKYSVAEQVELARLCRQDKLDLFHSPFYVVPIRAGCPVVATIHDLIPFLFRIYSPIKTTAVKAGYRLSAWKAQHIIADSENTSRDVQQILHVPSGRITPVPIAAGGLYQPEAASDELALLERKYNLHPPYVVAASARNWRTKNLETALRCLRRAREKSSIDFQTLVYGPPDGILAAGGEERWRDLNLRRAGFVETGDLAMIFRHAQAFVFPSLYEGFGLPILEAMSCGCPVITSSGGSLAEVAGKGAQVFDPFDVEGMADAVVRLVAVPKEFERWRLSALARATEFSWDRAARETLAVYHRTYMQAYASR